MNNSKQPQKKFLVVQMAKLGDMVCTTPMFRAIKKTYPSARVTVMGSAINKEVLADNPDVDEYLVFEGVAATAPRLRARRFDAAFLAGGPDIASALVASLAGIPRIVAPKIVGGRSPLYSFWYRFLLGFLSAVPHRMGTYAPREYLRLLEPAG